jgi:hypothetical protein
MMKYRDILCVTSDGIAHKTTLAVSDILTIRTWHMPLSGHVAQIRGVDFSVALLMGITRETLKEQANDLYHTICRGLITQRGNFIELVENVEVHSERIGT